ncbi:MAG TPA: hypothetical protein DCY13_12100 [Verrucomicrobiales bacterium]|nr:hypothetical protein [Verrucomicrobiales bacterium]
MNNTRSSDPIGQDATRHKRSISRPFAFGLVAQVCVYGLYLVIGIDRSGAETEFQRYYYLFYLPVLLLVFFIQQQLGIGGWGSLWFVIYLAPLLGAVVYSAALALAVRWWRGFGQTEKASDS